MGGVKNCLSERGLGQAYAGHRPAGVMGQEARENEGWDMAVLRGRVLASLSSPDAASSWSEISSQ